MTILRTKLMHISVFWEMQCKQMPCCSFAKTRWKLRGPLSTPFSGIQQPWRNTNQAHGDLMRQSVWLTMWAAGMTPKDATRTQSLHHAPRKELGVANRGLRIYSDNTLSTNSTSIDPSPTAEATTFH